MPRLATEIPAPSTIGCWTIVVHADRRSVTAHVGQDQVATEVALQGGFVNQVVRVADTVRRSVPEDCGFTQELLALFEQSGWAGAPRLLGIEVGGRQILQYLPGHVAWEPEQPPQIASEHDLIAAACLARQFHDLTAGTTLAGDQEVACHNDLAHVCLQHIRLGSHDVTAADVAHKMRLICDAYRLHDRSPISIKVGTKVRNIRLVKEVRWREEGLTLGYSPVRGASSGPLSGGRFVSSRQVVQAMTSGVSAPSVVTQAVTIPSRAPAK
jgi:hypothetical protein